MTAKRSVLIVDRSEETREVLRTALERRGLRILTAPRVGQGVELARQHHPDLIVLDLDDEQGHQQPHPLAGQTPGQSTRLVLLGSAPRAKASLPEGEFIAKPYHYAPLIRKIEQLLSETQPTLVRSA